MIYRSLALVSMATFYIIYFVKLFLQKKRGISVYKLAQNEKKSKKNITEILLKIVSFLLPVLELVSIVIGRSYLPIMGKVIGVYFAFFADFLFLNAVISMKDSWRVGVAEDEKDRKLITSGIYKFSRNPAFLAFALYRNSAYVLQHSVNHMHACGFGYIPSSDFKRREVFKRDLKRRIRRLSEKSRQVSRIRKAFVSFRQNVRLFYTFYLVRIIYYYASFIRGTSAFVDMDMGSYRRICFPKIHNA